MARIHLAELAAPVAARLAQAGANEAMAKSTASLLLAWCAVITAAWWSITCGLSQQQVWQVRCCLLATVLRPKTHTGADGLEVATALLDN